MSASPTSRSLQKLRKDGWVAGVVEKRIPGMFVTQDFLGGIDIVAASPSGGILGVQTTSNDNLAARRSKLLAEPRMRTWLLAGGKLVVHGWSKKGARGKRKLWECREVELLLSDFEEVKA